MANIPLCWMVKEAMQAQCGILFENEALSRWNIPLTISDIFHPGEHRERNTHESNTPHEGFTANDSSAVDDEGSDGEAKEVAIEREQVDAEDDGGTSREKTDALQGIHDQLKTQLLWWLLEIIPEHYSYQSWKTHKWVSRWT